jgi:hypothetical protein
MSRSLSVSERGEETLSHQGQQIDLLQYQFDLSQSRRSLGMDVSYTCFVKGIRYPLSLQKCNSPSTHMYEPQKLAGTPVRLRAIHH